YRDERIGGIRHFCRGAARGIRQGRVGIRFAGTENADFEKINNYGIQSGNVDSTGPVGPYVQTH
ncbi:MAG: hypothetical protein K2H65_04740, partial [Bacteroidales bacterium]|nr:hypothetical protein [Bacteroidales bacterium]